MEDANDITTFKRPRKADLRAKAHDRAWMEGIQGEGTGEKHEVDRNGSFLIGRTPESQIRLADSKISRRHSEIHCREGEYHLKDLGSTNGTYVNQVKVVECRLHDGDLVQTGDSVFRFRIERHIAES